MSVGCDLFFFFFFGLTLPNYRNKSRSAQRSPPSYQLLPPPLVVGSSDWVLIYVFGITNTKIFNINIVRKDMRSIWIGGGSSQTFLGCHLGCYIFFIPGTFSQLGIIMIFQSWPMDSFEVSLLLVLFFTTEFRKRELSIGTACILIMHLI